MDIGIIGLGRMGGNIARRLMRGGHKCVVLDRSPDAVKDVESAGAVAAKDPADMLKKLPAARAPCGSCCRRARSPNRSDRGRRPNEQGRHTDRRWHCFYKDDIRRAKTFREKGVIYVDVGTSGGVWGLERGYCLMIGGDQAIVTHLDPIFSCLAPGIGKIERTPGRETRDPRAEHGYMHCGPAGSGHFVKMIHNGIEYGLMQAYAEGFDILRNKSSTELPEDERFDARHGAISPKCGGAAASCRHGCSISAPLRLTRDGDLKDFTGSVGDSGEGRWTVEAAIEEAVPADVLSTALYTRFRSRREHTFAEKLLSAMRFQFGGHVEQKK